MMYLQILAGFVLLLGGAEYMVRGAVVLAKSWGISPLIIGMTIVAIGTSAPEFLVTLNAALVGSAGMALGNVVGSNIANILLVLGVTGLVASIPKRPEAHLHDGAMLFIGSMIFTYLCWRGVIGLAEGVLLLVFFAVFLGHSYWRGNNGNDEAAREQAAEVEELAEFTHSIPKAAFVLAGGLAAILWGSDLLVEGGVSLARTFGVSDAVIGLTLVAFGTSLPELATSVVAAARGHPDMALGNVVGSNLFNVVGIVGVVAMITPLDTPAQLRLFDIWVMGAATLVLLPFLIRGWGFGRGVAAAFLGAYLVYIAMQGYGVSNLVSLAS